MHAYMRAKAPTARKIRRVIQASVGRVTAKTFLSRKNARAGRAHVRLRATRIRDGARTCVRAARTQSPEESCALFSCHRLSPGFFVSRGLPLLLSLLPSPFSSRPLLLFVTPRALVVPFSRLTLFFAEGNKETWERLSGRSPRFIILRRTIRHNSIFYITELVFSRGNTSDKVIPRTCLRSSKDIYICVSCVTLHKREMKYFMS